MERLSVRRIATATVPLALLLVACGEDATTTQEADSDQVESMSPANEANVSVDAVYHENGTRTLRFNNDGGFYADVFQFCDGQDLLEQTAHNGISNTGRAGNAIVRTTEHPACADGILTPQDFELGR